jgi:AcrR family transcriptional regulator
VPTEQALAASLLARMLDPEPDTDELAERVLDGALAQFRDYGLSRTTMDDVARRAGLSRVTIYRRFQNKNALIEAVLLRECRRCLDALNQAVAGLPGIRERMVEGYVFALRYAREHPLVGGLLKVEPQVILPFMTVHAEPALIAVRTFLAMHLRRAQDAGELTEQADVEPIAELMARIATSFVISPYGCLPMDTDEDARAFARRFLVPLLGS